MRSLRLSALACAALLLALSATESCSRDLPPARKPASGKPNVVVVLIDTLRPDHLPFYGYRKQTAAYLGDLATQSTVFLNAMSSSSWTAPATASLFTGLYPNRHGVVRGFFAERKRQRQQDGSAQVQLNRIAPELETLPQIFQRNGYRTFGIAANLNIGPEIGFDRGFDRFQQLGDATRGHKIGGSDAPAAAVYAQLRQWYDELRSSDPYFLYLHFNDPHGPFTRRDPWYQEPGPDEKPALAAYDSEIGYVDAILKQIDDDLKLSGGIRVVVSDHGNAFGEHGRRGHGPGAGLFGVVNRIVFLISAPDHGVVAQRIEEPVSIVDALPTLVELTGITGSKEVAGRSLATTLRNQAAPPKARSLFAHLIDFGGQGDVWAVMQSPWKLIREPESVSLYDIIQDPAENADVASAHADVIARLDGELRQYLDGVRAAPAVDVGISPAELERLRSLGYAE